MIEFTFPRNTADRKVFGDFVMGGEKSWEDQNV